MFLLCFCLQVFRGHSVPLSPFYNHDLFKGPCPSVLPWLSWGLGILLDGHSLIALDNLSPQISMAYSNIGLISHYTSVVVLLSVLLLLKSRQKQQLPWEQIFWTNNTTYRTYHSGVGRDLKQRKSRCLVSLCSKHPTPISTSHHTFLAGW